MTPGIVLVVLLFAFLFASIVEIYRRQEWRRAASYRKPSAPLFIRIMRRLVHARYGLPIILLFVAGCGGTSSKSVSVTPPPTPAGVTAAPTFTPSAGPATVGQAVTIASATENAEILYSTDGTQPSIAYTTPLPLTASGAFNVKAIAMANGAASTVSSASYTVSQGTNSSGFVQVVYSTCGFVTANLNCINPVLSAAVGPSDAGSTTDITQPCIVTRNAGDLILVITVSAPVPSYNWSGVASNPATAGLPSWASLGVNNGTPLSIYSGVTQLATTQTSSTQPWVVDGVEVRAASAGSNTCFDLTFDNRTPPNTISKFGIWLLEYAATKTDIPSIAATWNAPVEGNAITNPTITAFANEPLVSFGLSNGSTILAGNGAASRLSILDSTGILLQDQSVGQGAAAPQIFVSTAPSASFFLSIGLEPQPQQ